MTLKYNKCINLPLPSGIRCSCLRHPWCFRLFEHFIFYLFIHFFLPEICCLFANLKKKKKKFPPFFCIYQTSSKWLLVQRMQRSIILLYVSTTWRASQFSGGMAGKKKKKKMGCSGQTVMDGGVSGAIGLVLSIRCISLSRRAAL